MYLAPVEDHLKLLKKHCVTRPVNRLLHSLVVSNRANHNGLRASGAHAQKCAVRTDYRHVRYAVNDLWRAVYPVW